MPPPQCSSSPHPRSHVHAPTAARPPSHARVLASATFIAATTLALSSSEATTAMRPLLSLHTSRAVNQLSLVLPSKRRATKPWCGGDGGGGEGGGAGGGDGEHSVAVI